MLARMACFLLLASFAGTMPTHIGDELQSFTQWPPKAVDVPLVREWFVAMVRHNIEKESRKYEAYEQEESKTWQDGVSLEDVAIFIINGRRLSDAKKIADDTYKVPHKPNPPPYAAFDKIRIIDREKCIFEQQSYNFHGWDLEPDSWTDTYVFSRLTGEYNISVGFEGYRSLYMYGDKSFCRKIMSGTHAGERCGDVIGHSAGGFEDSSVYKRAMDAKVVAYKYLLENFCSASGSGHEPKKVEPRKGTSRVCSSHLNPSLLREASQRLGVSLECPSSK